MDAQYRLSGEQLRQIELDLTEMCVRADEMFRLLTAGFGDADPRAIRAEELMAAIQRLQWAMERTDDVEAGG